MQVYNGSTWQVVAAAVTSIDNSSWAGVDLSIVNGGTGASDASNARNNLGLQIGVNVLSPNGDASGLTNLPSNDDSAIAMSIALGG